MKPSNPKKEITFEGTKFSVGDVLYLPSFGWYIIATITDYMPGHAEEDDKGNLMVWGHLAQTLKEAYSRFIAKDFTARTEGGKLGYMIISQLNEHLDKKNDGCEGKHIKTPNREWFEQEIVLEAL